MEQYGVVFHNHAVTLSHKYPPSPSQLWAACQRTLTLPLGRGALLMGTLNPLPTETLPVDALCLSGKKVCALHTYICPPPELLPCPALSSILLLPSPALHISTFLALLPPSGPPQKPILSSQSCLPPHRSNDEVAVMMKWACAPLPPPSL